MSTSDVEGSKNNWQTQVLFSLKNLPHKNTIHSNFHYSYYSFHSQNTHSNASYSVFFECLQCFFPLSKCTRSNMLSRSATEIKQECSRILSYHSFWYSYGQQLPMRARFAYPPASRHHVTVTLSTCKFAAPLHPNSQVHVAAIPGPLTTCQSRETNVLIFFFVSLSLNATGNRHMC